MNNLWDNLMGDEANASNYMMTYGEGINTETRQIIASFIEDGESVIDVGCGPAWNCDHFKEYGPEVLYVGVDLSRLFIKTANERIGRKYGIAPIVYGDCRNLEFPDGSFDVVILQDVLEHTNGYKKPVREALRVAKKRVIICMWQRFTADDSDHINDNTDEGTDGYGAQYGETGWFKFLNSLDYPYLETETSPEANRYHHYYIIDKEGKL